MTRRKSVCLKWTLVLFVVLVCPSVYTRPNDASPASLQTTSSNNIAADISTQNSLRTSSQSSTNDHSQPGSLVSSTAAADTSRNVKTKGPIRDAIKSVANQLLENPKNVSVETPVVIDTRIPPKIKNQVVKHKIKTRNEDGNDSLENSHAGVAVPVTMEELETDNSLTELPTESSTSGEGISTWILLSNPTNKDNNSGSTEPTKVEEVTKKQKPNVSKNKNKKPQNIKAPAKRPIIGSTNKSDLVAGGSAINENVFNKIKDTVLSNVQKNKSTTTQRTTTTTVSPFTEALTSKKDIVTKAPAPMVKITSKPSKKKNKLKTKGSTTVAPVENESASLPMEPKEQEIELEVSTPATTTKKPKRTSTKKKNKTKKRKASKPVTVAETAVKEVKTSNKTKSTKTSKKPTSLTSPISSQIYNYFSREVMPTVGVGVIGLAGLVGLASYFLYPFATPVRRTFEVDKKDDIYRHNAEEYANEGNGQAEEEMLGTVLAGMPAHAKQKLNPYAGQTAHINRYSTKNEQDIRYRQVANNYEPKYNVRYPQQKTGIAHGAVYPEPVNYSPQQYETRNAYTTESKYTYDKGPSAYTPYPALEPIYAAPQTGPSGVSSYPSESSNSIVYGVKPSADSNFKPVYPYEAQFYSDSTNSPATYPPTSLYLGSNNDSDQNNENYFADEQDNINTETDKFVVGNVPKELEETATPAVVPEHGPRKLHRKKRSFDESIEAALKSEGNDIYLSNEIDDTNFKIPMPIKNEITTENDKNIYTIINNSESVDQEEKTGEISTKKVELIESVSTLPIDEKLSKSTTESDISNELEVTTKQFKVYEVFPSTNTNEKSETLRLDTTTQFKNMNTETTTELRSETTSTMPSTQTSMIDVKVPSSIKPKPTYNPEVITYPPPNSDGGFLTFIKRLIEFKYRLGLSILQTTSDSLNRYLRSMENTSSNNEPKKSL